MRLGMLVNVRMGSTAKGSWGEREDGLRDPALEFSQEERMDRVPFTLCLAVCPWASLVTALCVHLCASQVCGAPEQEKVFGGCGPGCLTLNPSPAIGH